MGECSDFLNETREVFPNLKRKKISADYKEMGGKKLGYISAKIPKKLDFDPEALLLGECTNIKKRTLKPKEFKILRELIIDFT